MISTIRLTAMVLSALLCWGSCGPAAAQQETRQETREELQEGPGEEPLNFGAEQGEDIPILNDEQEKVLDSAQEAVTRRLLGAADWIDSFFDDRRTLAEENTSRAAFRLAMGYSRNDDFEIKPRLDVRLRLPRLSERANLFIEAAEDRDFNIGRDPLDERLPDDDGDRGELTAGLRYFIRETRDLNISLDGGISWNYLYASIRYRSLQDFGAWQGRFTNRLRYYTDDGLENRVAYDLERRLHTNWLFRTTTHVLLSEEEEGIPHSQYSRLIQVLSPYQAISYEAGVYFDTEPSYKMTDTRVMARYRQRFYRDWLVLEISPRVYFPEEHDRKANPGIIFQFEAAFGYKADIEGYRTIFN